MAKSPFLRTKSTRRPSGSINGAALAEESSSDDDLAKDLRDAISGSLINVGVLAALMMALAGAIYVDPPEPPGACYGENMLKTEMAIVWMAMGFFFFSTIGSVVLLMDIDGVPTEYLMTYLYNGQLYYSLPHCATALGIFLTAVGYGIDIGERGGCGFFIFGILAAPCFVLSIVALWLVCRWRRQQVYSDGVNGSTNNNQPKARLLATWADRVDTAHWTDSE